MGMLLTSMLQHANNILIPSQLETIVRVVILLHKHATAEIYQLLLKHTPMPS